MDIVARSKYCYLRVDIVRKRVSKILQGREVTSLSMQPYFILRVTGNCGINPALCRRLSRLMPSWRFDNVFLIYIYSTLYSPALLAYLSTLFQRNLSFVFNLRYRGTVSCLTSGIEVRFRVVTTNLEFHHKRL